ncbi:MAG: hypothetical protein N3A54_06655 [Patescibacteria group bacterium]|nr:hypothetical protein [Patescibacteria group bacterium]
MITLKYSELRAALPSLQKLFGQPFTNMKFLIRLKKMLDVCDAELKTFEEVRYNLITRFGEETLDENGNSVLKVKEENLGEFEQQINAVLNTEVSLNVEPITVKELEEYSDGLKVNLNAFDLKSLEKFILYE